ncbi:MAG TPA: redoxin domain-containing protein [Gemmatimonadales bacterium]|nr:redoxin domain-containing protein [Gemmatimonadales bacterium]
MKAYRDQYATLFNDGDEVVLLAISSDPAEAQASWAKDEGFPFTFLSDPGSAVGRLYGAMSPSGRTNNRNLFVIAPDGTIGYRQIPFREVDPTGYTELEKAIDKIAGSHEHQTEEG